MKWLTNKSNKKNSKPKQLNNKSIYVKITEALILVLENKQKIDMTLI